MKKKILSWLLTVMIVASSLPLNALLPTASVLAAEPPARWEGGIDTGWYNPSSSAFEINNAAEFAGLAAIVNGTADGITQDSFAGKTITLMADLDLGGVETDGVWSGPSWVPIGNGLNYKFKGTFNGNGKRILNFYLNATSSYQGLFGYVDTSGKIKNLQVANGYVNAASANRVGVIVADNSGIILNCSNAVNMSGGRWSAGITATNQSTGVIVNCFNKGNISSNNDYIGGIAAQNAGGKIFDCYNTGNISTEYDSPTNILNAGTIAGTTTTTGMIKRVYSTGKLTTRSGEMCVGVITGSIATPANISDTYYLKADGINQNYYGIGKNAAVTSDAAGTAAKTSEEMKALAATLGPAFTEDSGEINSGYPVLSWQTGVYEDETDGLNIAQGPSEITATGFSVALNRLLKYTDLMLTDFTVSIKVNGAETTASNLKMVQSAGEGATRVTFIFTSLPAEVNVIYSVKYKDHDAFTSEETTLPASDKWIDYAASGFAGGTGTVGDPYWIETPEQFAYMAKFNSLSPSSNTFAGQYVILCSDIDLAGKLWTSVNFNGYFDGKGHSVSNMQAIGNASTTIAGTGLFGETKGNSSSPVYLANVRIINPNVTYTGTASSVRGGGLVGTAVDTDIINCHVIGGSINVSNKSGSYCGGIAGQADCTDTGVKMSISFCSSTADVTGSSYSGGITGVVIHGNDRYGSVYFNNCWSSGTMTKGLAGGIIGSIQRIKGVEMNYCFSIATVNGNNVGAGGLIGSVALGDSGQVLGTGGLTIKNCAALNPSVSTTYAQGKAGRLVANADALFERNRGYFLNNYGSELTMVGSVMVEGSDANGTNVGMDTLYTKAFWEDTLGFDFSESGHWVWGGDSYYPQLKTTAVEGVFDIKITGQPAPATAYANKAALFGVQAEGGNRNYTYQWQYSPDNEAWTDITGGTAGSLSIVYDAGYDAGTYFRCTISDTAGHQAVSGNAILSVINEEFTVNSAKENLLELYQNKGILTQPREAFALLGVTDGLSDFTFKVPFYYSYSDSNLNAARTGYAYWTMMDCYALGIDPHDYKADGKTTPEDMDLIAKLLGRQDEATGGFKKFSGSSLETTGIPSIILSMEMYFNGNPWGNEEAGKNLGRTAAIDYFFSQITDYSLGGKVMGKIYTSGETQFVDTIINSQRMQTEAIALLARLSDDPVYGERAAQLIPEMMTAMKALYDNGKITYTENMAGYVSALVAAAGAAGDDAVKAQYMDLAKTIITDKLFNSEAFDGSYSLTVGVRALNGDKDAAAAVMMALGDYVNGSCILANYIYEISDKNAVQNDLDMIKLPSTATEDISLPDSGTFGSAITWTSSNTDSIKDDGKIIRGPEDVTVVLTAKAVKGLKNTTKKFTVTVKADSDADSDAVDSALSNIKVWFEAVGDIRIPSSPVEGVSFSWSSSLPGVLSADGKVTRPAVGSGDASVTLTVTATKGSVSKTKDFSVLVYALTDTSTNEGMVKEAAYRTRAYFLQNRVLRGYWSVWAAYSALGDFIRDPDNGYIYDDSSNSISQPGASMLALVAMGENPYNYHGQNLIENLIKNGVNGEWSVPVFNALGLEAAGSDYSGIPVGSCMGWMKSLSMGPDIGGWGAVSASRHLTDKYSANALSAIDYFKTTLSTDMASGSMGSPGLSYGCVIMGFTAFTAAGLDGFDVTTDSPWVEQEPILTMYENFIGGEEGVDISFNSQYMVTFCDLYNTLYKGGNAGWITCGVSRERLDAQKAKAQEILDNGYKYTEESLTEITNALQAVNGISEDRLNSAAPDYGKEYYALYDAVRFAQLSGVDTDKEAVKAFETKVNFLPGENDFMLSDEAAVMLARQAYENMTGRQKSMVNKDVLKKLEASEKAIDNLKVAYVEELINGIGTVTAESGIQIQNARSAYEALSPDLKNLVSNLNVLEAAEKAYSSINTTSKTGTKSVIVTLDGVQYMLDEATANVFNAVVTLSGKLPPSGATLEDIGDVFAAYKAYNALTDEQKVFITNYPQLEAAMNEIAKEIQTDEVTGLNVAGVPWYAGVKVEPLKQGSSVWDKLQGNDENHHLLFAYEVSLFDYANDKAFKSDGEVTVTMKAPDSEGYDGIVIVHRKSNGSIEYIKPAFNGDGTMSFVLKSFSPVGVLAYTGTSPLDLKAEEPSMLPWIIAVAGAVVLLGGVIVFRTRSRNRKEE